MNNVENQNNVNVDSGLKALDVPRLDRRVDSVSFGEPIGETLPEFGKDGFEECCHDQDNGFVK